MLLKSVRYFGLPAAAASAKEKTRVGTGAPLIYDAKGF